MVRSLLSSFFFITLLLAVLSCHAQKQSVAEPQKIKLSNEWVLKGFFDSEGKLIYNSSKLAEIIISPDEMLFTGNTGCNPMRGPVKVEADGKIKIGPVDNMRKRCPNAEAEKKFLEALECVTSYKIEGALLNLYCNEKPVLQFETYKN